MEAKVNTRIRKYYEDLVAEVEQEREFKKNGVPVIDPVKNSMWQVKTAQELYILERYIAEPNKNDCEFILEFVLGGEK